MLIKLIALFLSFSVPTRLNFVISDIITVSTITSCSSRLMKKTVNGNVQHGARQTLTETKNSNRIGKKVRIQE